MCVSKLYSPHRRTGFSLIEILVALAILALLVVLVLTVGVSQVRQSFHEAQCVNNMRETGMAILQFAINNNGKILPRKLPDAQAEAENVNAYWNRRLIREGYLPGPRSGPPDSMLYCPSYLPNDTPKEVSHMYGMRGWQGTLIARDSYLPQSIIPNPSRFFLIADSVKGVGTTDAAQWYTIQLGDNQPNAVHLRHKGKANAFFADGHVDQMGDDYFSTLHIYEPEFTYRYVPTVKD